MASLSQLVRRCPLPAVATFFYQNQFTACESPEPAVDVQKLETTPSPNETTQTEAPAPRAAGMRSEAKGEFHGMFPKRQLWQPRLEYPMWDVNWDGRQPPSTGDKEKDRARMRKIRRTGITRHIILVRHGQYDETHKEDEKRVLTELGRKQADMTGRRLAEMVKGVDEKFGPCHVKVIRVSNMTRAKETATLIARHLPDVTLAEPDQILNEARPAHTLPGGKVSTSTIEKTDQTHPIVEGAFQKYFHRADTEIDIVDEEVVDDSQPQEAPIDETRHEFEIIVCHANIIRYFACRALQLPPEAWLRLCTFNCSLTYLTIRPTGTVSCRMLGDVGHLPYGMTTFSHHHGYNW